MKTGTTLAGTAQYDPARQLLAYATSSPGDSITWQAQTALRILDATTGAAHQVGPAGLEPLAWMRDGRLLAYRVMAPAGGGETVVLMAVDVDSGSVTSLTSQPYAFGRVLAITAP